MPGVLFGKSPVTFNLRVHPVDVAFLLLQLGFNSRREFPLHVIAELLQVRGQGFVVQFIEGRRIFTHVLFR